MSNFSLIFLSATYYRTVFIGFDPLKKKVWTSGWEELKEKRGCVVRG
jgi:hypothetical protein